MEYTCSAGRLSASKTAKLIGVVVAVVMVAALMVLQIISAVYPSPWTDWTGFGSYTNLKAGFQHYKTLWDWMQLLIVPLSLAAFALWFTHLRESSARENEERRIREERLQTYFDRMTELILEHALCRSEPVAEVRVIARARTLTVLPGLDGERKVSLLRFLYQSNLISGDKPVITLIGADLSYVSVFVINLSGANLRGAVLREADLNGADLRGADLSGADLIGAKLLVAKLNGVNFTGAHLDTADLRMAYLTEANLSTANLGGANLSNADLREAKFNEADLSEANLSGANLNKADLLATDLTGANLCGADLSTAKSVTQVHIDSAKGNKDTKLPEGLVRPKHWNKTPSK